MRKEAMNTRTAWVSLAAVMMLALSACTATGETATGDTVEQPATSGGAIELAVSESCEQGSSDDCIALGDSFIVLPTDFERAEIASAEAIESDDSASPGVAVTFTNDGAAVLESLSATAASASSRLVVKVSEEIISAPMVAEPLTGNYLRIVLSPETGLDADEVVALIQAG